MPEENRVFDVSRPSKVSPPPTSRPVIVGHHPMNDPMVTGDGGSSNSVPSTSHTKIPVADAGSPADGGQTVEQAMFNHRAAENSGASPEAPAGGSPAIFSDQEENHQPVVPVNLPSGPPRPAENVGEGPFTAVGPDHPAPPRSDLPPAAAPHEPDIEGLHFAQPKPKKGKFKWIIFGIIVLLIAVYLAIDAGVFGSGVNLPFHVFKQKTEAPATPAAPSSNNQAPATPSVPAGYKEYKLSGTNLTFAAPVSWGDPTSATDPGYTQRGGNNKPTGTFAYLVNFATNKDIQIAVTSSKYLPAARTPLYYDYLQWCTGSNDNKIYLSILNFSTANQVDTPTTVTCDQGPISATPIDGSTIVQPKAINTAGKVIGDIYTMNLKDPSLAVIRVKDAAMTNGADIKQLLSTVQIAGESNSPGQ